MSDDDAKKAEEKFAELRGRALQNYANLEQALFRLFTELSGLRIDVAAIIYFKNFQSRQTIKMIGELLASRFGINTSSFGSHTRKLFPTAPTLETRLCTGMSAQTLTRPRAEPSLC